MWRGGRVVGTVLGAVVLLAVTATPAHAVILNFGVDIANDGSFSLTPFYDRSDDGKFLRGGLTKSGKVTSVGDTYTLTLDFTSAFTDYRINSATLFVDAKDVETCPFSPRFDELAVDSVVRLAKLHCHESAWPFLLCSDLTKLHGVGAPRKETDLVPG